ncbi:MAG: ArsA family ATPase [Deltaproteobacteria bacterium]|nr:ArsA family ATPase [Deltaproteobacteria bacterium]
MDSRRVILCVGSGGVGKTTTSAALGLAAARAGKRALCLTIDPARRLAQSLGLEELKADAQVVDPTLFRKAGLEVGGTLTVMMLNTKRTFDEIVERYASTPEARERILHNKLYHYVSTALAGTQEYMAMEKLHEVKSKGAFDLIVLDTPPTANALDFLDAPVRLIDALDSPAMRWFVQAFRSSGKLSLSLLAKSAALAIRGVGRFTGGRFLQDVAEFLTEINDLFGGFRERAREVQASLRAPDVAYVLVTSPSPMAISEALYFSDRLVDLGLKSDAFVVNRVHMPPLFRPTTPEVAEAVSRKGLRLDRASPETLMQALADEARQAELDARHLHVLDEAFAGMDRRPLRVDVKAFTDDVHDIPSLDRVARILVRPRTEDASASAQAAAL